MKRHRLRRILLVVGTLLLVYLVLAYAVLPAVWRHYEHHPIMQTAPKTTFNAQGVAADPLNVGIIGTRTEVLRALATAGWVPAEDVTVGSSVGIAESVLLKRPDSAAPVSPLYLFGRKQDLAFEKPVGSSAKQRHHVRLWQSDSLGASGRPLWLGGATFDRAVGFSHRTGQVTHHIAANVDAERDTLISNLAATHRVETVFQVSGVGPTLIGRNGGGDPYYTDGELTIALLIAGDSTRSGPPLRLASPPIIAAKNRAWSLVQSARER